MFCPRCGAQNKTEQKFCRNCGGALTAVRMAIEGKVDEVKATLEKDIELIASGALTLVIFVGIALIASIFSVGNAAFNLILGLLIGWILMYRGFKRANRMIKLLTTGDAPKPLGKDEVISLPSDAAGREQSELMSAPDTDQLVPAPNPVTEHTTLNLKHPERE